MKRSLKFMAWTTGAVSLLAAGPGCSHETHPAQTPAPEGTTSPPFESNVGPGQTTPAQPPPAPEMGTPSAEPPKAGPPQPGIGAPQPGAEPAPGATANERELCNTLAGHAHLKVEDVQNGVVIVMTPRGGADTSIVKDDARRIENGIHAGPGGAAGESCGLFTLGRLPSAHVQIVDRPGGAGLMITTTNPAEVKDLRREARDDVSNLGKPR
jgi:hypothetical protein